MMALEDVPGTRWLLTEEIREDSPIRLFCFPGNSGLATEFSGWSDRLNAENVECYCFQLPGSGSRRYEPALVEAEGGLDLLVTEMLKCMDKPFAFFGRGHGSQVCLALALELQARGLPLPRRLFVSDSTIGAGGDSTATDNADAVPDDSDIAGVAAAFSQSLRAFMEERSVSGGGLTCPVTFLGVSSPGGASADAGEMDTAMKRLRQAVKGSVDTAPLPPSPAGDDGDLIKAVDGVLCGDATKSREESVKLVEKWNSGKQEYPDRSCLHDMFRESATKNRDATAVVYKGASLTFGEVDDLTDALAGWLYSKGVTVGSTVGIFMEHRTEYALAYIAAHKATGAYMPLELVYPADLLEGVMKQVKPPVVLTQSSVVDRLPSWQTSLCMDDDGEWIKTANEAPAVPDDAALPTPDDLAYVVMSSGTTGAPKGICCPHRGAVHSYHHRLVNFPYSEGDREACHVFFVWELLRPLLGGMDSAGGVAVPLYVIPDDHIYDPPRLLKYLGENAITRMLFTPSLLQLVLDQCSPEDLREGMKTMRIVWLCGEVVTVELRNKFKALLPNCHMENLYSISECHDISFCNLDELDTTESPKYAPCGKVVPNVHAYILDDQLQQVPIGVPGRMWIAGPTLAIGYLNMPERTAERFVPDPFAEADGRKGERMYDTGDRCRYLPSGSIEVIGRCDFMVKVRGYSVVIGAVEAAITEHPLVSTAIVMTEGAEGSMDKKLVAYIVPDSWEKLPSARSIKTFLKSRLPPYAVPHVCILLDAIPINMASGKADKKKLPKSCNAEVRFAPHSCVHDDEDHHADGNDSSNNMDMEASATTPAAATTPTTSTSFFAAEEEEEHAPDVPTLTSTQRSVAKLWARLLKVDEATIEPSSDFFDLGGHSLLLAELSAALLKDMGAVVSIPAIIERPTLSELAELLDDEMTRGSITTTTSTCQGEGRGGGEGQGASASVILSTPALRAVGKAWCRVLDPGVESSLSPVADFFDLGGHSLLLAKLASALSDETGVTLPLQDIVQRSTLDGMARLLEEAAPGTFPATPSIVPALGLEATGGPGTRGGDVGGGGSGGGHDPLVLHDGSMGVVKCTEGGAQAVAATASARVLDLEAEARRLDASIYPASTRKIGYSRFRATSVRPPQRVLLTGASGFLGAHILVSLLRDTHVDVFCLVRAGNEEEALVRLEDTLHKYKLDDEEVLSAMDRVTAVPGDLSRPLLGLDDTAFKMLAGVLDAIIHSGASVNLVRSYQSLKAVNVLGTQEVLRLAVTNAFGTRVKPVHFVSTNGVFPFSSETKTFMEEADMSNQWQDLSDGYGQSKWVAEQMCVQARSRGLPVSILRPGNMSPSKRTGVWNPSDFIYMLLQGCLELGCVPEGEGVSWQIDVTPVDFAAQAMVHVAVEQPTKSLGHVLHIQNPGKMQRFEDVAGWLKEATGSQLEGVSLDEFKTRLGKAVDEKGPKDVGVLAQLESGLDGFAYYLTDPPHLDCAGLTAALEGSGIECPSLDKDLVSVYASTLASEGRE